MPLSMPTVREDHDIERLFVEGRKLSAGKFLLPGQPQDQRYIAILTPERHTASVQCPLPEKMTPEMIAEVRGIVPDERPQAITVIADTRIPEHGRLKVATVAARIPFLGYLLGIAYVGHTVVVFEGHPSALADGCRGADLLIVDEEMMDALQHDWMAVAVSAMRRPKILVCIRDGLMFLEADIPKHLIPADTPESRAATEKARAAAEAALDEEEEQEELDFDFLNEEEDAGGKK